MRAGAPRPSIRYPPEFKVAAWKLYRRGVKTYVIAKAINCSTKTVWTWITRIAGTKLSRKGYRRKYPAVYYGPLEPHLKGKIKRNGRFFIQFTIQKVRQVFVNIERWMNALKRRLTLEELLAAIEGEEPP